MGENGPLSRRFEGLMNTSGEGVGEGGILRSGCKKA